ncbi:MAG: hypothetical protein HWN67_13245 [Candidatus Helarchaeota archaeon]|nr:hypothetical protein [Candidatus Helarchaeota archaeon]
MSIEETIILALSALKKVISKEFVPDHTDVGVIRTDEKIFRIFSKEEKEEYIKKVP